MLIALNERIGVQTITMSTEHSSGLWVLSPLVGEVYLGTEQGFGYGRLLFTWLSWLLVSVLWFTPWSLSLLDGANPNARGKRLPKGTRLVYFRERFREYDFELL